MYNSVNISERSSCGARHLHTLHFTLHVVQEPQPSNPSESPEGNLLIDFETVAVKQLIKT